MLATRNRSPAILSETMRRVRLENDSVNRNWPARVSSRSGRRHFLTCRVSAATPSSCAESSRAPSWAFTPGLGWVRSSTGDHCVRWFGADRILPQTGAQVSAASHARKYKPRTKYRRGVPQPVSSFLEAVADAVERFDHLEIVVDHLELLAQPLDVAVDGAVVDIDLVVIGRIHQRVAALHHAGTGRERLQDQEFGDGQGHRLVLPGASVALGIHPEQAAVERLGVIFLRGCRRI